jgi:hypothetical protein
MRILGYELTFKIEKKLPQKLEKEFKEISRHDYLNNNFFEKYINEKISEEDWNFISTFNLSEEFINNFKKELNWSYISGKAYLSEKFLTKNKKYVDFETAFQFRTFSEKFIINNKNIVNWNSVSNYPNLTSEFIDKYKNRINWFKFSKVINIDYLEKFKDFVYWDIISKREELDDEFFEKWKGYAFKDYREYKKIIIPDNDLKDRWRKQISYKYDLSEKEKEKFINSIKGNFTIENEESVETKDDIIDNYNEQMIKLSEKLKNIK